MTTPTQETGQPLDFTRPLELVCDGTEVAYCHPTAEGWHAVLDQEGQHRLINLYGVWFCDATGPQIVRNRAEANTPVQGDGLVERLEAWADSDNHFGHHARAEDMLAAANRLAHQPTTNAEAAIRENIALRSLLAGGCDANNEGPHPTIVGKAGERFCADCGEMVDAKGRSKPWFDDARLQRAKDRLAHPPADKTRIEALEAALAPFALHIRDNVPDEQMIEGVGWTAADHRRALAAIRNHSSKQEEGR